jgi:hypothetical protein
MAVEVSVSPNQIGVEKSAAVSPIVVHITLMIRK